MSGLISRLRSREMRPRRRAKSSSEVRRSRSIQRTPNRTHERSPSPRSFCSNTMIELTGCLTSSQPPIDQRINIQEWSRILAKINNLSTSTFPTLSSNIDEILVLLSNNIHNPSTQPSDGDFRLTDLLELHNLLSNLKYIPINQLNYYLDAIERLSSQMDSS